MMLLNGDDVARCEASFRESKWLMMWHDVERALI
jgi:hypothetical protein